MGKTLITILILVAISLPVTCMTLITDSYGKAHAEESRTIFDPKYPAGVIYGFVEGCYLAFEDQQFMSGILWPEDLKEICGCVMDGIREAVPLQEFIDEWEAELTPKQTQMSEMFGMICTDQILKKKGSEERI